MSLSFAITTRGPAGRVRTLLEMVRPHVDEIVLAADRDGDPDVLDACADLVDRRLRFALQGSPAKLVGWIQHQCSADWILRLDDDEVPSPALLASLPELMAERRLSRISFQRRWLHQSVGQWIDHPLWRLDYQARLVRNVPGLWTFSGHVHTDGDVEGERRFSDLPIYHCDLLLASFDERRRKRQRYEAESPSIIWNDQPLNATYVPETFEDLTLAPVPPEDRPALAALVEAGPAPEVAPPGGAPPVREVGFDEIDRFNTTSRPGEMALRGEVEWVCPPRYLPAGALVHHDVRVRNLGDALWRRGGHSPTFLVRLRCRDEQTGQLVSEELEAFTETVWPGQQSVLLIPVRTPARPGTYRFELDLLHDNRGFGDGPRDLVEIYAAPAPASLNGSAEAVIEAQHSAREIARQTRSRREDETAADELQATRRYRFLDALTRPLARRPPGEKG